MVSDRKLIANVVGGKSARPCDSCIKKRARWYCAADDAFLCQPCDSSVHSANTLARRHERVLIKTSSSSKLRVSTTWHKGFTTKARTPRHKKKSLSRFNSYHHEPLFDGTVVDDGNVNSNNIHHHHLVPQISIEEASHHGESDRVELLYRVPIFEPFDSQIVSSHQMSFHGGDDDDQDVMMSHHLQGFLPSESDLAELGADIESLLGKGIEEETFDLGLLDSKACEGFVKVEDDDDDDDEEVDYSDNVVNGVNNEEVFDVGSEAAFELNFDYASPIDAIVGDEDKKGFGSKKTFLRLDYERVVSAWDGNKCPWTTGERPNLISGDCFRPDCTGTCGTLMHMYGDLGMTSAHVASTADAIGREARVSRYREKRRTRLFSKKIRYEVRKLNAEKRPRMKGRFVKRSNLA